MSGPPPSWRPMLISTALRPAGLASDSSTIAVQEDPSAAQPPPAAETKEETSDPEPDSEEKPAGGNAAGRRGRGSKPMRPNTRRKSSQRPESSDQARQAFFKRKRGLVLKAYQLHKLTDTKVMVFMVNNKDNSYAYATPGFGASVTQAHLKQMREMAGLPESHPNNAKFTTEVMAHPHDPDNTDETMGVAEEPVQRSLRPHTEYEPGISQQLASGRRITRQVSAQQAAQQAAQLYPPQANQPGAVTMAALMTGQTLESITSSDAARAVRLSSGTMEQHVPDAFFGPLNPMAPADIGGSQLQLTGWDAGNFALQQQLDTMPAALPAQPPRRTASFQLQHPQPAYVPEQRPEAAAPSLYAMLGQGWPTADPHSQQIELQQAAGQLLGSSAPAGLNSGPRPGHSSAVMAPMTFQAGQIVAAPDGRLFRIVAQHQSFLQQFEPQNLHQAMPQAPLRPASLLSSALMPGPMLSTASRPSTVMHAPKLSSAAGMPPQLPNTATARPSGSGLSTVAAGGHPQNPGSSAYVDEFDAGTHEGGAAFHDSCPTS